MGITEFRIFTDKDRFLAAIDRNVVVVVLDHFLDGPITGLEIMKEVIAKNPICYPIILSGSNDWRTILKYQEADSFRYIVKNEIDWLDKLVISINQALRRIEIIINYVHDGNAGN